MHLQRERERGRGRKRESVGGYTSSDTKRSPLNGGFVTVERKKKKKLLCVVKYLEKTSSVFTVR